MTTNCKEKDRIIESQKKQITSLHSESEKLRKERDDLLAQLQEFAILNKKSKSKNKRSNSAVFSSEMNGQKNSKSECCLAERCSAERSRRMPAARIATNEQRMRGTSLPSAAVDCRRSLSHFTRSPTMPALVQRQRSFGGSHRERDCGKGSAEGAACTGKTRHEVPCLPPPPPEYQSHRATRGVDDALERQQCLGLSPRTCHAAEVIQSKYRQVALSRNFERLLSRRTGSSVPHSECAHRDADSNGYATDMPLPPWPSPPLLSDRLHACSRIGGGEGDGDAERVDVLSSYCHDPGEEDALDVLVPPSPYNCSFDEALEMCGRDRLMMREEEADDQRLTATNNGYSALSTPLVQCESSSKGSTKQRLSSEGGSSSSVAQDGLAHECLDICGRTCLEGPSVDLHCLLSSHCSCHFSASEDAEGESSRDSSLASGGSDREEGSCEHGYRRVGSVGATKMADVIVQLGNVGRLSEKERKRQYRIGLNLFNKKPERGIRYLMEQRFLENSAHAVAHFLLTRKGLSRLLVGEYLGNLQQPFNQEVLRCFVQELDFNGLELDVALRKFVVLFQLPGEAQKIERIMEVFSQQYCICNPEVVKQFKSPDAIFLITFSVIMLNTDLHNPNIKSQQRMKVDGFVANLKGIDGGDNVDHRLLGAIYRRIREHELRPGVDHTTQVRKVEETIVGKCPILSLPWRRLVCYCRLYEVHDTQKKEKHGLHQREVFLFNDILVITKIFAKKKNCITYAFRESMDISDLLVSTFETECYQFGVHLMSRIDHQPLVYFNARNHHDREKFVEDLYESICEVNEMDALLARQELRRTASLGRFSKDSGCVADVDLAVRMSGHASAASLNWHAAAADVVTDQAGTTATQGQCQYDSLSDLGSDDETTRRLSKSSATDNGTLRVIHCT